MQFQEVSSAVHNEPSILFGTPVRDAVEKIMHSKKLVQGAALPPLDCKKMNYGAPFRELDFGPFNVVIDPSHQPLTDLPTSLPPSITTAILETARGLHELTHMDRFRISSLRGLSSLVTRFPHIDEPGFVAQKRPEWQVIIPLGRGTVVYPEDTVNRSMIEPYMLALMYSNLAPEDRVLFRTEVQGRYPYDLEMLLHSWKSSWRGSNPIVGANNGTELPPFTPLFLRTGLPQGLVHRSPSLTSREEDLERQVVQIAAAPSY